MTPPRSAAEVNRSIAEMLGWHAEINHDYSTNTFQYILFQPNGEMTEWDDGMGIDKPSVQFDSEKQAWQHAPDYYTDPRAVFAALPESSKIIIQQYLDWGDIPEYGTPDYLHWHETVKPIINGFEAIVTGEGYNPVMSDGKGMYRGLADTREAALALALLSMLEAMLTAQT